nr:hypothetical protein [Sinorhizobium meliloti]
MGIPTIRDRVVQGAAKILLEPIFEAQFWHVSYGFRPGRNTHDALEYIRRAALPQKRDEDTRRNRLPYPWVISKDASTISITITCSSGWASASVIDEWCDWSDYSSKLVF